MLSLNVQCLNFISALYLAFIPPSQIQSNPILVLTTIYQVLLYVYYDVQQRDGDRSSGREGTVIGARTAHEESVMQAIGVEGTVMGPLHLSMERLA